MGWCKKFDKRYIKVVEWNGQILLAVTSYKVYYSIDAYNWFPSNLEFYEENTDYTINIKWIGNMFILTRNSRYDFVLYRSYNGIDWTDIRLNNRITHINDVAMSKNKTKCL